MDIQLHIIQITGMSIQGISMAEEGMGGGIPSPVRIGKRQRYKSTNDRDGANVCGRTCSQQEKTTNERWWLSGKLDTPEVGSPAKGKITDATNKKHWSSFGM